MQITVWLDMTPCSHVENYRRFEESELLHPETRSSKHTNIKSRIYVSCMRVFMSALRSLQHFHMNFESRGSWPLRPADRPCCMHRLHQKQIQVTQAVDTSNRNSVHCVDTLRLCTTHLFYSISTWTLQHIVCKWFSTGRASVFPYCLISRRFCRHLNLASLFYFIWIGVNLFSFVLTRFVWLCFVLLFFFLFGFSLSCFT
jgi:hypothetical protein